MSSCIAAASEFICCIVFLYYGNPLENVDARILLGASVAQWVKRWPTDLAVPSSIPARGEIFSTLNGVPLHTAFHYHPSIVLI